MNLISLVFVFIVSILITIDSKPVLRSDRFKHSRELAVLKERFPASNIKLLRELNRNIKKTQASLRLVINMEKELKRTARNISRFSWEPEALARTKDHLPFSSWAG